MNKIFKSQKRVKKYNANRFVACLLAVLMLFSALSTGSITVHATETPVAQIGETTYTSLTEAITEAGTPATSEDAVEIKMLANITLDADVTIGDYIFLNLNGYTFDLNGHTLDLSSHTEDSYELVANGGNVIDGSNNKAGLLKLGSGTCSLSANNAQMPVYNTQKSGYVFATMTEQVKRTSAMGAEAFELIFRPYFGTSEINQLLANDSNATGVSIGIHLEWTDKNAATQKRELEYYDSEDAEKEDVVGVVYSDTNKAFYINVTEYDSFKNLTITPLVKSELGVEWSPTEFLATPWVDFVSDDYNTKSNTNNQWAGKTTLETNVTVDATGVTGNTDMKMTVDTYGDEACIKVHDSLTERSGNINAYTGFVFSDLALSGIHTIAFDLYVDSFSDDAIVLQLRYASGYQTVSCGSSSADVPLSTGAWKKVVLVVKNPTDTTKGTCTVYYGGKLVATKELTSAVDAMRINSSSSGTIDFGMKDWAIYEGDVSESLLNSSN